MFDIGFPELCLIIVIALVVFGPQRLPDVARALGRGVAEFKRTMNELKETIDQDETVREIKQEFQSAQRQYMLDGSLSKPVDVQSYIHPDPKPAVPGPETANAGPDPAEPKVSGSEDGSPDKPDAVGGEEKQKEKEEVSGRH